MKIDSIYDGIVLDHIRSGNAMEIYQALGLDKLDCPVAMIMRVKSRRMGTKDLIKIDAPLELDFDLLGYIDSGITVNIIRGGQLAEKRKLSLPERIVGVLRCKNPRCITSVEQGIQHEFFLADHEKGVYRCAYCEAKYERSNG